MSDLIILPQLDIRMFLQADGGPFEGQFAIDPLKDIWPFVREMHGEMCHAFSQDGVAKLHRSGFLFSVRKSSGLLDTFRWKAASNEHGTHIMIFNKTGLVQLHFIVTAIHTRAGVVIKSNDDVANYFDPTYNSMLRLESKRRKAIKTKMDGRP